MVEEVAGGPVVEERSRVVAELPAGRSAAPQFPLSYFCQLPPSFR